VVRTLLKIIFYDILLTDWPNWHVTSVATEAFAYCTSLLHDVPQVYITSLRPSYDTLYITSVGLFYRTCVSPTLHNQSTSLLRYDIQPLYASTTLRYIQPFYVSLLRYKHFTSLYYATVYTTTLRLSTTLRCTIPLCLHYATVYVTSQRFSCCTYVSHTLRYAIHNQSTSTNVP
jgi:hypothetical protein